MVATLYGISGANQSQQKYNNNEALIAAEAIWMDQSPNTPYFITTDLNDDPAKSDTVCRCVESDIFADLPADWKNLEEKPRTFFRTSISAGM